MRQVFDTLHYALEALADEYKDTSDDESIKTNSGSTSSDDMHMAEMLHDLLPADPDNWFKDLGKRPRVE